MTEKIIQSLLLFFLVPVICGPAWAGELTVQSGRPVGFELTGFDGLAELSLFKGEIGAGGKRRIKTAYRGLTLLVFAGGQSYPVIIGADSFSLMIVDPGKRPVFTGSPANDYLYRRLAGSQPGQRQYAFADLMLAAKDLLESSYSIKTVAELNAKKKEFLAFVGKHFLRLRHSDMVIRLIGQYFMMLEYADYHVKGAPATDIKKRYQREVMAGVENWLDLLVAHLSRQVILNYCVGLYYKRSMVALAAGIIDNFRDSAFCPGESGDYYKFSGDMKVRDKAGGSRKLADLKGDKIIAFVSEDCPVSMVETVIKARRLARWQAGAHLIVAPLEKLAVSHLALAGMIQGGGIFFLDDAWRKERPGASQMKLPAFITIPAESAR